MKKFLVFGLALVFLQACSIEERPVPTAPTFGEISGVGGASSQVKFVDNNGQLPNIDLQQSNGSNLLRYNGGSAPTTCTMEFVGLGDKESSRQVRFYLSIDAGRQLQLNRTYSRSLLSQFYYQVNFDDYSYFREVDASNLNTFEITFSELTQNSVKGSIYVVSTVNGLSHSYTFSLVPKNNPLINW